MICSDRYTYFRLFFRTFTGRVQILKTALAFIWHLLRFCLLLPLPYLQTEKTMIHELTFGGKIQHMNQKASAPVFPKSFYTAYTDAKKEGSSGRMEAVNIVPIKQLSKSPRTVEY